MLISALAPSALPTVLWARLRGFPGGDQEVWGCHASLAEVPQRVNAGAAIPAQVS